MTEAPPPPPVKRRAHLEMRDITVAFGAVTVLDGAHLEVRPGEIHALLGENGAGKSSLMKVLFGLYPMRSGRIVLHGSPVAIRNPRQALENGIAMIHQELPFALHLSVAQNIFLGREYLRGPMRLIDEDRQDREAAELLERFPIDVDPRTRMGRLSVAQQQVVAIAKALSTGAELIVLDESTTALTGHETEQLFLMLDALATEGKTFVMITHKLDEVFRIAHRVTVMRDGRTVASSVTSEVAPRDLVRQMVGREVSDFYPDRSKSVDRAARPRLVARGLTTEKLRSVSFELYPGEVLGIGGLMGAGRTSLFHALFGVDRLVDGRLFIDGTEVAIASPADAIAHGLAYITEDRKANGLALLLGITENVTLPRIKRHTRFGWLKDGELERVSRGYVAKLSIDARTARRTAVLSGGNQQKVVLAKWLATGAEIFILDEPTRGIDVGTKLEVYGLINELTDRGKSVLLVTSELPELMAMSDRFLVLSEGTVVKELSREEATAESIVYFASMGARGGSIDTQGATGMGHGSGRSV